MAEWPGRTVPGGVSAKLGLDFVRGHAFVEVPAAVVGAHVLKAEPEILTQVPPRLRSAVFSRQRAARHVACAARRGRVRCIGPGALGTLHHHGTYVLRGGTKAIAKRASEVSDGGHGG